MRSIDQPQRVYIWRSYFANRFMMAASKGFLSSWRKFMMGHTGDIQTRYGLRKQLQDDVVAEMRRGYEKALPFLETAQVGVEDPLPELLEAMLRMDGVGEDENRGLGLAGMRKDEQVEAARRITEGRGRLVESRGSRQKLVALEDVERMLKNGWIFKATLPDGRNIMQLP